MLEVIEAGEVEPSLTAPGADIRTDVPGYRIYRNGELTGEVDSLVSLWQDDLVSFLLGCSFSFEAALADVGIPLRHQEMNCNVPMYITNTATTPAGVFSGPMVVSMRPIKQDRIVRGGTGNFPVPGNPRRSGPYRRPVCLSEYATSAAPTLAIRWEIRSGEEPVFWACGVTPQAVALNCKPSLMITHAPGYMFVTGQRDADYAVL